MVIKALKREKLIVKNFKITSTEFEGIKKLADKYADGNVSQWVRYAAKNFRPSKSDLSR